MSKLKEPALYQSTLERIKQEIRTSRLKAVISVNSELLSLYHKIGCVILKQEEAQGWGKKVVARLSADLKAEFPDMKGISPRNFRYMKSFAQAYPDIATLQATLAKLTWYHHITLLDKVKDKEERLYYIQETAEQGWSRDIMVSQIESGYYTRKGKSTSNFERVLPNTLSDLAQQTLKDPYIFDFLTIADKHKEKDLENALIEHITNFLMELGKGFAYVGKQYPIEVSGHEFHIDLLFYHLKLRSYVIIELKATEFEPEFAGKLNFYLSAVDAQLKHEQDQPSIGLLICRNRDKLVAEYALRDINKPIGISEYKLAESLPENLKSTLPTIEEIEEKLAYENKI